MIIPVVLSGGSGARLWPLSRRLFPKQFHAFGGEHTLLQKTVKRLDGMSGLADPIVICNAAHRFLVAEQLRELGRSAAGIYLEESGRNTCPAIAVAALAALAYAQDAILLVLPADHQIADDVAFQRAVGEARPFAEAGRLVTFGVLPEGPETGFGYIQRGASMDLPPGERGGGAFEITRFVEKPDVATAQSFVDSGEYFWNSGIFEFRANRFLEEMQVHQPDMLEHCRRALEASVVDLDFIRLDVESFGRCDAVSVDYAVMEKTTGGVVLPLRAGWSDVGTWAGFWSATDKSPGQNVVSGDVIHRDVNNSVLISTARLVAAIGLDDHVVVESADAVLVASKERTQEVRALVEELTASKRREAENHRREYRPWGFVQNLHEGEGFRVNRLCVHPGARLSFQRHLRRSEHWVVVEGQALVRRDGESAELRENESTFIPSGVVHQLENPGEVSLELIEIQVGAYLEEDDIERLEAPG